jgi:hypothetical protein
VIILASDVLTEEERDMNDLIEQAAKMLIAEYIRFREAADASEPSLILPTPVTEGDIPLFI